MTGSPDVVVFDLGNVLIEWDRARLFSQLIHDRSELQYFLDNVLTLEANRRLDEGTPLAQVAAEVAAAHPDHGELVFAFADRWRETIGDAIEGSVRILGELAAAGVPIYALSNWGADTFAMVEPDFPFLAWFDGLVISGREGVTKPDPRIYEVLCRRYGFEPDQAVFVDDSPANVESARDLGFDALLFDGPEGLRRALVERGLLRG